MKRVRSTFFFSSFAAACLLATLAHAEPAQDRSEASEERRAHARELRPRYANTAERWRGRPSLRSATSTPGDISGSERVFQHLPSVNFLLKGQHGGAFTVPRF